MDGENLLTQPFWYVERVEITKNGRHPDGRNMINQLDEKTKVLFRLDVGEHAHEIRSMGYDVVNHMNIEIQRCKW